MKMDIKNRAVFSRMSAKFFGDPSRELYVAGITGTNGKTTITYLLEAIFKKAKYKTGVIGTVNWRHGGTHIQAVNTTPGAYELQRLIREMANSGVKNLVMEVSSHGIEQKRVQDVEFDACIFTNLTHDHLDYHGSFKNYFKAKLKLFTELLPASRKKKRWAVINIDDEYGRKIVRLCDGAMVRLLTYGFNRKADVRVEKLASSMNGNEMMIKTPWGKFECKSSLKGRFNVLNVLAAVACAGAYGINLNKIKEGIGFLRNVPGRLEEVPNKKGISIFVDYAHTPDALKNILSTLREISEGRLITLFGCGGGRDRKKRPLMGREACMLSDMLIVTSDNPRSEKPASIIKDILKGVNGTPCVVEEDRRKAIKRALSSAKKGDVVVIAGKGHEDYQIIGDKKLKFCDREEVLKCLSMP